MRLRMFATVLCLGLLVSCGDGGAGPDDDPASPSATDQTSGAAEQQQSLSPEPMTAGTQIVAADSEFGSILFDGTGQAIYLFDVEADSQPACYDDCAAAWPPVLTQAEPIAGGGVQDSLLGTTQRTDGTAQVTYNNHPLYFYAHEGKNEVKCHDVFMNGGNWYVVQPDGNAAPPRG